MSDEWEMQPQRAHQESPANPDVNLILKEREKEQLKEPPKYSVVFINDDFTPMDFVIEMLEKHFGHSLEEATGIMLDVHQKGKGIAGTYSKDIAETKTVYVSNEASNSGHPLKVGYEPAP